MEGLMIPMVQAPQTKAPVEVKGSGRAGGTAKNFSEYMEKKAAVARQEKKNLLGAEKPKTNADPRAIDAQGDRQPKEIKAKGQDDKAETIASLLGQFVAELKESADEVGTQPGDWTFTMPGAEAIEKIALDAGMSEAQLGKLMKDLESQDGKFDLPEFLDFFARHFEALQDEQPVTAPETDLPLLQILLERLGVPAEDVAKLSDAAVLGDNTIDLEKFVAGLQDLQGEGAVELTDWEAEQLQDILAKAGVAREQQRDLLPERFPVWQDADPEPKPLNLTLDRLKNILEQGVQDAKAGRLQADLPSFLSDLKEIMTQATFDKKEMGWTPAVQESVTAIFDKLIESIDLASVKIRKVTPESNDFKKVDFSAENSDEQSWDELLAANNEEAGEAKVGGVKQENDRLAAAGGAKGNGGNESHQLGNREASGDKVMAQHEAQSNVFQHNTTSAAKADHAAANAPGQEMKTFNPIAKMPLGLQQQSFAQITSGVLGGLRNQEHHLVMTLFPKELGEVKVEMMVRDEQIALSFSMENHKVKEVFESNMQEFKDSMEEQGFIIEECMVSVSQEDKSNDAWRQFEASWKERGSAAIRKSLADLPDEAFYHRSQRLNPKEQGLDLFA
ncbi:MAG: flagellar hook-length control protein FliK [Desulfobulbaceae bacterium]|nr:flagellar hook-length control protein FliK [Desulfobulbaceae bacterium]HIJ78249.1 flagellar hook-length control protein FliK [Deltaproteobacteria bacterium]